MDLTQIVQDFATGISLADARAPQAISVRSKKPYQPGIGPHTESQTVELVVSEMASVFPHRYGGHICIAVPYPDAPRQKCDIRIEAKGKWDWAIEVKMLRMLGDNGKPNDNILMHILSPYPAHRSALTDCSKLAASMIAERKAILIYGYEAHQRPLILAVEAFETLASKRVALGPRSAASFDGLIHPVHSSGQVFGWQVFSQYASGYR